MSKNPILQNFPQWEKLNKDLLDDPYDDNLWNELVSHHEKLITDHFQILRTRKELKELMYSDLDKLITKFPYFEKYWKRYVSIVEKIDGLNACVELLNRATTIFPYSLTLWLDYLNLILTNNNKSKDEIVLIFNKASDTIGYHYTSSKFWDLYLNWAKNNYGENSNDYIKILVKLIKIPLYDYAKYNDMFNKLRDNFQISDLVERTELINFIKEGNESIEDDKIDEYIESNSTELIESYYNKNLEIVQLRAQEKWKFENEVKFEFDLNILTNEEINKWNDYIDYEIKTCNLDLNLEVISIFERSLIATCSKDDIWIKYARYMIHHDAKQYKIIAIFNKACDHFVPIEFKSIRYMYIKYMELKLNKIKSCKEIFMSMIKQDSNNPEIVSKYIQFLIENTDGDINEVLGTILKLVHKFNFQNTSDQQIEKKRKTSSKKNNLTTGTNTDINNEDLEKLFDELNLFTIGQLVVNVSYYYWLKLKNINKCRDIFMIFFDTEAVKSSKSYWYSFFKFEICQINKKNLTNIINYVSINSRLFPKDINFLIEEYNSFIFKNFTVSEITKNQRSLIKNILETDIQSSLYMKHYLKIRLSHDGNEETVDKHIYEQNGHPGAICEGKPILINPIDPNIDNLFDKTEVFQLPKFRNVQKANSNVKYIHESIE